MTVQDLLCSVGRPCDFVLFGPGSD